MFRRLGKQVFTLINTLITASASEAAKLIRCGKLVAFPTETVYGLGADIFDANAVGRIFEAKMRPADNPLIAHIAEKSQIECLAARVNDAAEAFIDAFFPGPLTIVLPKRPEVPMIATAGLDTVGIRMPAGPIAREFLDLCRTPVVAPSANLSGRPSPTTWQAVYEDLNGRIDCILQGPPTEIGLESTVVDCSGDIPLLLREGGISFKELIAVVPETRRYEVISGEPVRSPGLKHRHYSPRARVVLVKSDELMTLAPVAPRSGFIGVSECDLPFLRARSCSNAKEYAREIFAFFRECDNAGVEAIYCETVDESGIGAALMDRLRRAAE